MLFVNKKIKINLMDALKELLHYHDQFLFQILPLLHEHDQRAISDQRRRKKLIRNEKLITNYVGLRSLQH